MKVSTLKEIVRAIPDELNDSLVYVSSDEEGNSYRTPHFIQNEKVIENGWDLEFYEEGYHDKDQLDEFSDAVVIW